MEIKQIWLWVLEGESNKELSILCSKIGATMQGFRNNKVTDKNRQLVIRNLLTPKSLNRLREIGLQAEIQEMKSEDVTVNLVHPIDMEEVKNVIKKLLITNQEDEAKRLYEFVINQSKSLDRNEGLNIYEQSDMENEATKGESGKIKKLEKKIEKLKKHYESEINRLREKNRGLEEENELLTEKIKITKNDNVELQNKINTIIEEKEKYEVEKINTQRKMDEFKMQYGRLHAKIAHLEDQIREQTSGSTKVKVNGGKEIALIGNPRNETVYSSPQYNVTILEGNELDLLLAEKFEEVWILGYKVPLTRQRKWLDEVEKPVYLVETYTELLQRLEVEM